MTEYTRDGGVIPGGVPRSDRPTVNEHFHNFGLYKGQVQETIYPEDSRNTSGERIEYKVKIKGQIYLGAVDMRRSGGIFDFSERSRKGVEKSRTGKVDESTFDENLDGEIVYILFLEGHGDLPIIVGAAEHPQRRSEATAADNPFDKDIFNGVSVKIDKDSNFVIEQVGKKDPSGQVLNSEAVGSKITVSGSDGSIEVQTSNGETVLLSNGLVTITADRVTITADQVDVGGEDDKAVLAGKLATVFDGHFHATAVGPSGPPLPPNTFAVANASPATAIEASKVNLKGNS